MSKINKIKLSGTSYDIEDKNASKTVELTQAQYDALVVKDPNTFYVITDAQGADLSNYYTKSETSGATEISTALNAKADTATTYTKTEVDTALGGKVNTSTYNTYTAATDTAIAGKQATLVSGTNIKTINNESLLGSGNIDIQGGGGTASSAITSGDTNAVAGGAVYDKFDEVESVTAAGLNALNDKFGGLKLVKLTQAQYNALSPNYDNATLYIIIN